ncbi:MAG: glycoside hydrolase family 97 N-terminal domain-containing protein, partial [Prevotellaceae bacterium]|nr:glycoside hydrolase family 97 N-terminal domain-containing protein [Prevotellaceae bacterium]
MKKVFVQLLLISCILPCQAKNYQVMSPNKSIIVQIEENETLSYSVLFHGKTIIEPSALGRFEWKNEPASGNNLEVIQTANRSHNETWTPVVKSKHAQIKDQYNELTLFLREKKEQRRTIDITFRVYDDGVAFRYKLYRGA